MGKKRSMDRPVQNDSFQNLVAKAASKRMEEFMEQRIQMYASAIRQEIASLVLKHTANIQTRQLAFESLFDAKGLFKEGELEAEITRQEDLALGLEEVSEAQKGDCVRIEFSYIKDGKPSETEKLRINSLLQEVEGRVQTDKNLEEALVGMAKGSSKEIALEAVDGQEPVLVAVKIYKVSRVKASEEK